MLRLKTGLVEVYTGNGKGKTTAAFGLAFRAVGWGMKVYVIQFMKMGTYGENQSSAKFADNLKVEYIGKPYFIAWEEDIPLEDRERIRNVRLFPRGHPPSDYVTLAQESLKNAKSEMISGKWDIVIMDEINVALYYKLIEQVQLVDLIDAKPGNVELVFTGRNVPEEILKRADLITEMREIKHPYSKGVSARRGIDF
ncbi:MAG: ATP--corrinoid adenosyltransferase [Thermoplasmatales archaeon B_DKE]|nr:MAG: ATP--corrinoid adenosyltransferase [Thermoplasmatales archaeon B_DKE]